ncbi:hypothetical protein ABZU86_01570 [Streptomyces sp. NPDC005271]|uniref:hypothetical protein n=1 Tax=unclassified Streptomyces TaxID=2593676 RepID=UPI0033A4FD86
MAEHLLDVLRVGSGRVGQRRGTVTEVVEPDSREADLLIQLDEPPRDIGGMDLAKLAELRRVWGVSIHSLVYRCRELGLISDATASRTYQRLRALDGQPGFTPEAVSNFSGEQPSLLRQAFELACKETDLSAAKLAHELAWTTKRVRDLLGVQEQRPVLRLVQ